MCSKTSSSSSSVAMSSLRTRLPTKFLPGTARSFTDTGLACLRRELNNQPPPPRGPAPPHPGRSGLGAAAGAPRVRTEQRGCGEDAIRAAGVRRGCGGGVDCQYAGVRRGCGPCGGGAVGGEPFWHRRLLVVVDGDVMAAALLGARGCACASAAARVSCGNGGGVAAVSCKQKSRRAGAWEGAPYFACLENLTCPFRCDAFFLSLRRRH